MLNQEPMIYILIDFVFSGARVILACRNVMRAERAATDIMKKSNTQNVAVKIVDLASLESIRKFADDINKTEPRVDILINNAGLSHVLLLQNCTYNGSGNSCWMIKFSILT